MSENTRQTKSKITALAFFATALLMGLGFMSSMAFGAEIHCSHVIEACQGTLSNDDIYGWSNQNEIAGRDGRDHEWGYAAFDLIQGEVDGDSLNGGEGGDDVYGGYGNDSYFELGGNFGLYGQSQNDSVWGNIGRDFLEGNQGQDGLHGGDSADIMFAEDGEADTVNGGAEESGWEQPCYVDGYDAWTACKPY